MALLAALLIATVLGAAASPPGTPQVSARLLLETAKVEAGSSFLAGIELNIAPGWHVYGEKIPEGEAGLPTSVEWRLPAGFTLEGTTYPPTVRFESAGGSGDGYTGKVIILSRIRAPADLGATAGWELGAKVSWLACERICVPGSADLAARLGGAAAEVGDEASVSPGELRRAAAPPGRSLGPDAALAVLLAFLGGLLLNLMPCVLPVLSLKVSGLLRDARADPRARAARGIAYAAGVLVSFWAIAGLLLVLRAGGAAAGWGFQFQDPRIVSATAAVFFLVALNLFGVYEVGFRVAAAAAGADRGGRGLAGAFGSGFLATAAATPCTAPFMGAALGWAISRDAVSSFAVFTALGLGMALPFLGLSLLPSLGKRLPAPGRWMETLRQAMGFPMAGTALWMVFLVQRLAGADTAFRLLAALLAAGAGAWIWGRWVTPTATPRAKGVSAVLALLLVLGPLAGVVVSARAGGPSVPEKTAAGGWEPWSPGRVAELREAGVPVFVDFRADWCLTCVYNERTVLETPEVRRLFRDRGVVLLVADWTGRDAAIARELEANGRAGVPLYLLYPSGGGKPRILPELLTRGTIVEALEGLP